MCVPTCELLQSLRPAKLVTQTFALEYTNTTLVDLYDEEQLMTRSTNIVYNLLLLIQPTTVL